MSYATRDYDDPVLFGPTQLVTSSRLSKNLGEYLNKTENKPIFIQKDNNVAAVLLNIEEYRSLLLEEQRVEDLYIEVLAIRRMLELIKNEADLLDNDAIMKHFNVTPDMLED